jgi:hypothetical protein
MKICLLLLLIVPCLSSQNVSVLLSGSDYEVVSGNDPKAVCWATYDQAINTTGWAFLDITSNNAYDADEQAYAAGFVEGWLTADLMYDYWQSYAANEYKDATPSKTLVDWMTEQLAFARQQGDVSSSDPAKVALYHILRQFDGQVAGVAASPYSKGSMSEIQVYMLQAVGDLEDLNGAVGGKESLLSVGKDIPIESEELLDCSGYIRLLPDHSDVVMGQTTWRSFYAMLRVYKTVSLAFSRQPAVSFSSSPGLLHSKDDFYALNNGLLVAETTNGIYGTATSLYKLLTPSSLLSWQRVMLANRLATNGEEWANIFSKMNSGTYNNQWMIVDTNVFTPGKALPADTKGLLWISEQIPGTVASKDVSSILLSTGYWGSYNIPYSVELFNASGYDQMVDKYGDTYSYSKCPRARIFARNTSSITTIDDVRAIMLYNDWQNDPLSIGSPIWGIAARVDLNCSAPGFTPKPFGGIDAKVSSALNVNEMHMNVAAYSGPTHDQQKPFVWSDHPEWSSIARTGTPDVWDFEWQEVMWSPDA